jgi:hypothetical protein
VHRDCVLSAIRYERLGRRAAIGKGVGWLCETELVRQFRAAHRATPESTMLPSLAAGTDPELAALANYIAGLPHR